MKYFNKNIKILKNGFNKVKKLFLKTNNNHNINGKKFEIKTSIEKFLINCKKYKKVIFNINKKYGYYLENQTLNYINIYLSQHGFKYYMNNKLNVPLANLCRLPDEAFIHIPKSNIRNQKIIIYIIEKKYQITNGSCSDKLMTGNEFKIEYKNLLGKRFHIEYGYVLNDIFFKKIQIKTLKNINLNNRLKACKIPVFNGNKKNYKTMIYNWIRGYHGMTDA
jgi:hypothetical protein